MKYNFITKLKSLDIDIIVISKCYLSGLLAAMTVFGVMNWYDNKSYKIGTVNITGIVDQFSKKEAGKHLQQETLKKEIMEFGNFLEKDMQAFSKERHLILLPSEAVIAGSRDYTQVLVEHMSKQISHEGIQHVE